MSNEKPNECECCNFETKALKAYDQRSAPGHPYPQKWLCELCASSPAGTQFDFKQFNAPGELHILQTICYVGNAIIAAIGKGRKP